MRPKSNGQAKGNAGPKAKASDHKAVIVTTRSTDKTIGELQQLCWDLAKGIVGVLSKHNAYQQPDGVAEGLKTLIAFGPGDLRVDEPLWLALQALHSVDRFLWSAKAGNEDMLQLLTDIPKANEIRDPQWILNRKLDRLEMLLYK